MMMLRCFFHSRPPIVAIESHQGRQESSCWAMEQYGIPENLFRTRTTVAFVWRYRAWGSAVKPIGQPSAESLVDKYSARLPALDRRF